MRVKQDSFFGGMSLRVDPTRLDKSKYPLLVNGRNRVDTIRPNKKAVRIDDSFGLPAGNYQGIFSAGSYLLVFISGLAYFKDFNYPASNFSQVTGFMMDSTVARVYAELVPASTLNYARVLETAGDLGTTTLSSLIPGSLSAIIVQDGISRPKIIDNNMVARTVGSYDSWTQAAREYVPIGKQMLHQDGILYVISVDGKRIYRSVSGRPLDFMVNITDSGNKLATEEEGGAETVSHSVDYEAITAIKKLNSGDGGFFVSTKRNAWKVVPLYSPEDLVFGEPTFRNDFLFSTGAVNNESFVELLGDSALVEFGGLRSFNAVQNYRVEGRNSPFSLEISDIFKDITQVNPAGVTFDNYGIFSMDTVYGRASVVFDSITSQFVGLDIPEGATNAIQFAEVKSDLDRELFFISDNKLFAAYSSENTVERCQIYVGEWTSNDPYVEQKVQSLKLVFEDVYSSGTIYASLFVDGKEIERVSKQITQNSTEEVSPIEFPFGDKDEDKVTNLVFQFSKPIIGWKFGFFIDFNGIDATLSHVAADFGDTPEINPSRSAADNYAALKASLAN